MLFGFLSRSKCFLQLRKCQTKCAIDQQINLDDSANVLNNRRSTSDKKSLKPDADLNGRYVLDHEKESGSNANEQKDKKNGVVGKGAFFFLPKKKADPNIRDTLRLKKYKKAMGLPDDMPFDEASKLVNEYFDSLTPGINFFEKTGSPVYGRNFNSLISRRSDKVKQSYKYVASELFEKKVIFDFSYDSFMNQKEKNSLIYQVIICLGLNRKSRLPFPILFANVDRTSYVFSKLDQFYLQANKSLPMVQITEKSYLDLLPKEQIIYLSPHAEESLVEYLPDYNYVLGGFIDISFSKSLSHKKAQAEGVKCYKLPIDEYVAYSKIRNRLLPLPIVHQILLDKKENLDWKETLQCNLGKSRLQLQIDELEAFEHKYTKIKKHLYAK